MNKEKNFVLSFYDEQKRKFAILCKDRIVYSSWGCPNTSKYFTVPKDITKEKIEYYRKLFDKNLKLMSLKEIALMYNAIADTVIKKRKEKEREEIKK